MPRRDVTMRTWWDESRCTTARHKIWMVSINRWLTRRWTVCLGKVDRQIDGKDSKQDKVYQAETERWLVGSRGKKEKTPFADHLPRIYQAASLIQRDASCASAARVYRAVGVFWRVTSPTHRDKPSQIKRHVGDKSLPDRGSPCVCSRARR